MSVSVCIREKDIKSVVFCRPTCCFVTFFVPNLFFPSFSVICILVYMCFMALVNCSVYNPSEKCVVLPWKIMHVGASGRTIEQYFNEVIGKEVIDSVHTLELVGAFLGRSKEQLDAVDTSVLLHGYGRTVVWGFLRYHVSSCEKPREPQQSRVDAFQIMMSNVRQQSFRLLGRRSLLETKRTSCSMLLLICWKTRSYPIPLPKQSHLDRTWSKC